MKAIAYYRVSTAAQGRSGLGLEAQRHAVNALALQRRFNLLCEFTEVESGKKNDRPVLDRALQHARITDATLVIAKLDRLSRNAAFLLTLRDSGVRFLAADVPDANDLTIGVLAVVAQAEREAISRRTKEALSAVRQKIAVGERHVSARSGKEVRTLGSPIGASAFGRMRGDLSLANAAREARSAKRRRDLLPVLEAIRADGHSTWSAVASELNRRGVSTPRGARWHASTASRYFRQAPGGYIQT